MKNPTEPSAGVASAETVAPDANPTEPSAESAPKGPLLLTPLEWAKRLGLVGKPSGLSVNGKARPAAPNWRHAAADQLHGWSAHGQNTVDPLLLSQEDYEAALCAAEAPNKESLSYQPHAAALSPFAPRGN